MKTSTKVCIVLGSFVLAASLMKKDEHEVSALRAEVVPGEVICGEVDRVIHKNDSFDIAGVIMVSGDTIMLPGNTRRPYSGRRFRFSKIIRLPHQLPQSFLVDNFC
jgi:hypothetical protein